MWYLHEALRVSQKSPNREQNSSFLQKKSGIFFTKVDFFAYGLKKSSKSAPASHKSRVFGREAAENSTFMASGMHVYWISSRQSQKSRPVQTNFDFFLEEKSSCFSRFGDFRGSFEASWNYHLIYTYRSIRFVRERDV